MYKNVGTVKMLDMKLIDSKLLFFLVLVVGLVSCSAETEEIQRNHDQGELEVEVKPLNAFETAILDEIIAYRNSIGLNTLEQSPVIRTQVYSHVSFMIDQSRLSHDNYLDREYHLIQYAGAESVYEIVASGYHSAEDVVNAWLNSEVHKKGIEGKFTHFNVSAEKNDKGVYYFACMFMKK